MLYWAHSTLQRCAHSNHDTDGPSPELLLLPARHFHAEVGKNAHEYKYIFSIELTFTEPPWRFLLTLTPYIKL